MLPQKKPQQTTHVKLIAHRGAHDHSKNIMENTLQAFEKAEMLGCFGIEFDVHATKDQVIVVHHDPSLERLWQLPHLIKELDFQELRNLAPQIPTLHEVVQRWGKKLHFFIELKAPFRAEKALTHDSASLIEGKDYHIITLNEEDFEQLQTFNKAHLLLVPEYKNVQDYCQMSQNKNYGGVLGHYLLLTQKNIQQLTQKNQIVGVGFVDSKNSLFREINRGIEWIFTNQAHRVANHLRHLNETKTH